MYTLLGHFLGPTVLDVVAAVNLPLGALGSLVPLSGCLSGSRGHAPSIWAPPPRLVRRIGASLARPRGCRRPGHIDLHAHHQCATGSSAFDASAAAE